MFKERNVNIKQENDWKYINVGLVHRWEFPRKANVTYTVTINNIKIDPSSTTDDLFIYDFAELRKQWFDMLGNTSRECDLLALEDACYYSQLQALNHYAKNTSNETLRKCIFTNELTIFVKPQWSNDVKEKRIEFNEFYVPSDVHVDTYKQNA